MSWIFSKIVDSNALKERALQISYKRYLHYRKLTIIHDNLAFQFEYNIILPFPHQYPWLQVTSKKDQEQYWEDKKQPYRYIPVKEFLLRFKQFHAGLHLENELAVPYENKISHKSVLVFNRNLVPKMEIFKAGFAKEWLLVKRNSFVYIFKETRVGGFTTYNLI